MYIASPSIRCVHFVLRTVLCSVLTVSGPLYVSVCPSMYIGIRSISHCRLTHWRSQRRAVFRRCACLSLRSTYPYATHPIILLSSFAAPALKGHIEYLRCVHKRTTKRRRSVGGSDLPSTGYVSLCILSSVASVPNVADPCAF